MRKKQGVLVIMDGLGDRPHSILEGKTPLEYAKTPNIDQLVVQGMCGNVYPISPGIRVGTDVGHLHIFGFDSHKVYRGRGPLEAVSGGIELSDGDVAFRGNFATVDDTMHVVDRRAGRIKERTKELAEALNGMILIDGTKVLVKELTEHRVAVVFRGEGLSDAITCTDPGTTAEGSRMANPSAKEPTREAGKTANNMMEFSRRAYAILKEHPVNKERESLGKLPANIILTRGAGQKTHMPSVQDHFKLKAACIAGDMTIGGIARLVGIDYHKEPKFTGGFDTDIEGKAELAVQLLKEKGYDWVVVHVKGTDLAGHDNLPLKKIEIIEQVDKMFGYFLKYLDLQHCYMALTADHSTPCEVGDHTGDSVPTFITGADVRKDEVRETGECYFMKGNLNNLTATDIFMLQMDLMGFTEKVGS